MADPDQEPSALRHAEEVMGTVFSFDVRGGEPTAVRTALEEAVTQLHRVDEVFSTYREDSQISRLARGELTVEECDPEVAEVLGLCAEAERVSDGWFSSTYEGRLDPTGSTAVLGGPAPYWQSYGYDALGNRKTQVNHAT
ncbi:FAD:protein FMN transferase, partial [Streptomyces sp. NPDC007095]|uniref:FAD:protein FMN transferase n=1 Tax=Streptomyces sp. NPDC007095 TaxID=3154482 RepID=UPI0033E37679